MYILIFRIHFESSLIHKLYLQHLNNFTVKIFRIFFFLLSKSSGFYLSFFLSCQFQAVKSNHFGAPFQLSALKDFLNDL